MTKFFNLNCQELTNLELGTVKNADFTMEKYNNYTKLYVALWQTNPTTN